MNRTGNRPHSSVWLLWLLTSMLTLVLAHPAGAALEARVDRNQIAMGDTLRLEITATGGEDLNSIDFGLLQEQFDILQRSSSNSVNIVNGQRSESRKLVLEITPQRQGDLLIPSLVSGSARTAALSVRVGPQPESPTGDTEVLFDAELDRDQVYVQGQVVLTLRVQQAINLDNRSVTELNLDNAFVKPLEQNSFQRTVGGRPWLVHEIRYAIFPEQSGTLEIPAQTFSARESLARRSLFDRSSGPLLRRSTEPLTIEVLPRPDSYPADATWLPARNLTLEEQWSVPPEQLQAGESATRTVRIVADGLQGAQLPPTLFPAQPGLRYYPDQPQISETETGNGLAGQRTDSAALVPGSPGHYRIPEVRIPWWDTESGELREAVLPAREIEVTGAAHSQVPAAPLPDQLALDAPPSPAALEPAGTTELWWWRSVAVVCALGWLLTLALWWRGRNPGLPEQKTTDRQDGSESQAFKQLMAACASNQSAAARQALQAWGASLFPGEAGPHLKTLRQQAGSEELDQALDALEQALFAPGGVPWEGASLAHCVTRLRPELRKAGNARTPDGLTLYPA
ncbi:protein BatD [Parahaliea maris]|uniref:Protein BatD n=1 Tax=Parahaliea maris TaxID=2716870 RepID=A0A5C8ZZ40_9GAMM|nr:BatD family protein [Parahaliea maris]TXS92790.1 protein BatD [Parahaliea maris]